MKKWIPAIWSEKILDLIYLDPEKNGLLQFGVLKTYSKLFGIRKKLITAILKFKQIVYSYFEPEKLGFC